MIWDAVIASDQDIEPVFFGGPQQFPVLDSGPIQVGDCENLMLRQKKPNSVGNVLIEQNAHGLTSQLMAMVEFNDAPDRVHGDIRIVLVDFFDIASALKIIHNRLRLNAGTLNDRLSAHLARDNLNSFAFQPVHLPLFFLFLFVAPYLYLVNRFGDPKQTRRTASLQRLKSG